MAGNRELASRQLTVERKDIEISLAENERGAFLRLVENAHGRKNMIIIPITGGEKFRENLIAVMAEGMPKVSKEHLN